MELVTKTYYDLQRDELDEIIEGFYGLFNEHGFNFTWMISPPNGTRWEFDNLGSGEDMDYEVELGHAIEIRAKLEEWEAEGVAREMLEELAYFDLIPKGAYVVDFSW